MIMKKISILGSTGSIGTQTLELVRLNNDISVTAISAYKNINLLEETFNSIISHINKIYNNDLDERMRYIDTNNE